MSAVILRGDAANLPLPDASVDLICTSPPYWSLRDYRDGGESLVGQIGAEETSQEYLASLLECTREWVRVLRPTGSIFVNLGDAYSRGTRVREARAQSLNDRRAKGIDRGLLADGVSAGTPEKLLLGLPWRYAIGAVDQLGLVLRRDIIWHKVSGMPESVTDRCATRHEYLFHLVRQPKYFAAVDEIREPHTYPGNLRRGDRVPRGEPGGNAQRGRCGLHPLGRLPGSVWEIAGVPLLVPDHLGADHFAAWPPELCRRVILGWSPRGICTECGEGRRPVVEAAQTRQWALTQRHGRSWHPDGAEPRRTLGATAAERSRRITGYSCACPDASAPARRAVVADPFGGTGTTALVADVLGRTGITIDRSADYCRLARWRTSDPGERARALGVPKPPPVPEGQGSLFDEETG